MKELTLGVYQVFPSEVITLDFTPTGVSGEIVVVSLDGETLDNVGTSSSPKFEFTVNKQPGSDYSCKVECAFPSATGNPSVTLKVSGSFGGITTPLVFTLSQPDLDPDFRVVAAPASTKSGSKSVTKKSAAKKGAAKSSKKSSTRGSKKGNK